MEVLRMVQWLLFMVCFVLSIYCMVVNIVNKNKAWIGWFVAVMWMSQWAIYFHQYNLFMGLGK